MLSLLLLLLVAAEPSGRAYHVRNFAAFSPDGLGVLDGKRVVVRLERDSLAEVQAGRLAFDCAGPNPDDGLHRTCHLIAGERVGWVMVVAGRLRVIRHAASADGLFPAFTEVRLEGGRVVRVVKE
jgi:hypothetical protein